MQFDVAVCQDEDGMYIAECPAIPGCMSQGKAEPEVVANVRDAINECLEARAELGAPYNLTPNTYNPSINDFSTRFSR